MSEENVNKFYTGAKFSTKTYGHGSAHGSKDFVEPAAAARSMSSQSRKGTTFTINCRLSQHPPPCGETDRTAARYPCKFAAGIYMICK